MESVGINENCSQVEMRVDVIGSVMVPPAGPSPKSILYLSNLDDHLLASKRFDILLLYNNATHNICATADPVKIIREALSQVLTYYYPLAGRVKRTQDGRKLQVDCTGEGALFVEAATDSNLSVLGELDELKPSFQQLLFQFSPTAVVDEVPPVIFQVTRFHCGGFVVGVSFNHSLCDARGAAQFLNGFSEITRGKARLSTEPVWQREVLKPDEHAITVRFQHEELLESGFLLIPNSPMFPTVKAEELVLASFCLTWDAIQRIKQPITEELKEHCSTFDVLSALAWRARTKALGIPLNHALRILFAVNVRRKLKPSMAEGYYGNAAYLASARTATAEEVVTGSLSHAVKIIKKAKQSVNDEYVKSSIAFLEKKRSSQEISDVRRYCVEDAYLSDWRWLGFNESDFGWGEPVVACPVTFVRSLGYPIIFVLPPNSKTGVKMVFCVPGPALKVLETEMHVPL